MGDMGDINMLTKMMRPVFSGCPMKLNGSSYTVRHSAGSALSAAIVPLASKQTIALRSWAHLTIWVGPGQRAQE